MNFRMAGRSALTIKRINVMELARASTSRQKVNPQNSYRHSTRGEEAYKKNYRPSIFLDQS